jgi:hypothetical protein
MVGNKNKCKTRRKIFNANKLLIMLVFMGNVIINRVNISDYYIITAKNNV